MEPNEIISSGLLELYVLGMTNEQETAQVLVMRKQYPEVAAELLSIEMSLEHYSRIHCVNPNVKLKEKIFTAVTEGETRKAMAVPAHRAPAQVVTVSPFWKYVAAASVILLIGSILMNYNYYTKYETAKKETIALNNEKISIEQQFLALQQINDTMKQESDEMRNKWKVEPVALDRLPDAPADTKAKILWMKNTGDVYIDASNLPDAPDGMQYQFWGIVDGKPVDGGMIITTSKENKYRIQKMKAFGKAEAFAVTLETAGGNAQPKGKMYVMGKM